MIVEINDEILDTSEISHAYEDGGNKVKVIVKNREGYLVIKAKYPFKTLNFIKNCMLKDANQLFIIKLEEK